MKLSEFITVSAVSGLLSAIGATAVYSPPCEINLKALETIEAQNKRLSEQNERLSEANQVIHETIKTMPDNQKGLIDKQEKLLKEIDRYQKAYKDLQNKKCKDETQSELSTPSLLGLVDHGKKLELARFRSGLIRG